MPSVGALRGGAAPGGGCTPLTGVQAELAVSPRPSEKRTMKSPRQFVARDHSCCSGIGRWGWVAVLEKSQGLLLAAHVPGGVEEHLGQGVGSCLCRRARRSRRASGSSAGPARGRTGGASSARRSCRSSSVLAEHRLAEHREQRAIHQPLVGERSRSVHFGGMEAQEVGGEDAARQRMSLFGDRRIEPVAPVLRQAVTGDLRLRRRRRCRPWRAVFRECRRAVRGPVQIAVGLSVGQAVTLPAARPSRSGPGSG